MGKATVSGGYSDKNTPAPDEIREAYRVHRVLLGGSKELEETAQIEQYSKPVGGRPRSDGTPAQPEVKVTRRKPKE